MESFVTELGLPMLVCLELTYPSVTYMHVIGISPCMSAETGKVEFHIIDGSHPEKKAIYFNKQNIDWCFGHELSFQKISCGFVFVAGRKECLKCSKTNQDTIMFQGLQFVLQRPPQIL